MKKTGHFSSFLSGAAAALTLSLCLTTALAAAGKVSYNFANVSLDGGTVIAAEADITAANGQKIPGSILYTDETGGKTNYLPLRKISELLKVEVNYDSASKTVYLGKMPAPQPAPAQEEVIDLSIPKEVPKNPRRGDVDLIKSRGGTILPDDDVNSYRGNEKMYRDKNGSTRYEYLVGNDGALPELDKKAKEIYLVNEDFPRNKKGETYGTMLLADYVGYAPDLEVEQEGYVRFAEKQAAGDALDNLGLSKEECPHEYTYPVYDKEGEFLREAKGTCRGHFEGKSREYIEQAMIENRLW
ncbi:hypothetical protein [uncultured Oscillibacter sp.]|uniref:hypothetical protein n=1 Tax=uncultured Oscillibacter sp. TaxID=876091 RepID=UPI00260EA45B|nr:hypothetical protein [uncultured Oscillibacter sp.]